MYSFKHGPTVSPFNDDISPQWIPTQLGGDGRNTNTRILGTSHLKPWRHMADNNGIYLADPHLDIPFCDIKHTELLGSQKLGERKICSLDTTDSRKRGLERRANSVLHLEYHFHSSFSITSCRLIYHSSMKTSSSR